ncbi:hypothetical protein IH879_17515 [candidate division KSB1 bacterium]|nr:hypothetical protein [candidate division KSB1 bacterium]
MPYMEFFTQPVTTLLLRSRRFKQAFPRRAWERGKFILVIFSLTCSKSFAFQQTKSSPEDFVKGREILKKVIEAAGGVAAFDEIDNFRIKTESKIFGQRSTIELVVSETVKLPDKTKQIFELATGQRIQVLNGEIGWSKTGETVTEISNAEMREMKRGLFRDTINLFKRFDGADIDVQYLGKETIQKNTLFILNIKNNFGDFFKLYVNSKTYLIEKKSYHGGGPEMAILATLEEIYSDYHEVDGLKIPFHTVVKANGKKFIESNVVEVEFNLELREGFFMRE